MKSKFFVFVVAVVVLLGGATATPARRVASIKRATSSSQISSTTE